MGIGRLLIFLFSLTLCVVCAAGTVKDTREGANVSLECRFAPQLSGQAPTYFWIRKNKSNQDNVAVQSTPLDANYRLDYRPEQGRYDLLVSNVSYARDDGEFECRVKAAGSGRDLHTQAVTLTVLTPPGPPFVSVGPNPSATEGKLMELNCSSQGGSPTPTISWYRDGSTYALESDQRSTVSHENVITTSVLALKPLMRDDGAMYRCVVWNRAMPDSNKLEAKLALSVNYFPRVEVGPENPLRVERDGSASLQCSVDSKPKVANVRWTFNGRFISTSFTHVIDRVTLQDAGTYTCTGDNGLGQTGEAQMTLDVLYPPAVTIETGSGALTHREAEEGESLVVKCNVTANPEPTTVEWVRQTHPEFRQTGQTLRIDRITSEHAGTYTCRAVNIMSPSGQPRRRVERVGNATITLLVRHKPGKVAISPEAPVAAEGQSVTLSCSASPPGWPAPQYRWYRDTEDGSKPITVLATGQKYTIPTVHLASEGKYQCQATNEIGAGTAARAVLEVQQPPRFVTKLPPHVTKRIGDAEFAASCAAQGKPKPLVKWLKDGYEISPAGSQLMEVRSEATEGRSAVFTVQSTLRFRGENRHDGNRLIATDRGVYSCVFENEVKRAESSMQLRIEHEPIILHPYNKVAYDLGESAEIVCRVQAYPRPEFSWSYAGAAVAAGEAASAGGEGRHEISTAADSGDVYTSVLKTHNIRDSDYGEYACQVSNTLGSVRALLRLQAKGAPEHPLGVTATGVGPNYVTLGWEPGFDGGLTNTKFFVSYRRVPGHVEDAVAADCGAYDGSRRNGGDEQEFDCQRNNPCNVTSLDQHNSYTFKVKAFNTKGKSNYSAEVGATTKVARILAPQRVTYDPESHQLSINAAATCLQLIAYVETAVPSGGGGGQDEGGQWQLVKTLPMVPGHMATRKDANIFALMGRGHDDDVVTGGPKGARERLAPPRVRVKLCLRQEQEHCSPPTAAEIGPSLVREAGALNTPTVVAIAVSCVVFVLFAGLMYVFCRCKRGRAAKGKGKDYEVEQSVHPSLVTQPPPPYYPAGAQPPGMEPHAALDRAMDCDGSGKPPLYGYHANMSHTQHHNPNGGEWVNMGYMDNSYSNSNNGGSVNSQDSLWQMKMAAAAGGGNGGNGGPGGPADHHLTDRYGYDPIAHGGYGTAVDDYAPYSHLEQNHSRQDYNGADPYAPVHKAKKRFDQLDAPGYHDVSGLPDPYLDPMDCDESKPHHISLSFDESLESGYSTPNSRNRRVIREIIV